MANSLGTRPIVVDTPGSAVLINSWMKIGAISWSDYTADAHTFVIQDQNGHVVYSGNGRSDLAPVNISSVLVSCLSSWSN
jgi:hypothetical protein